MATEQARPTATPSAASVADQELIIVGSGFSGLGVAALLDRAGFSAFTILEAADDLGGAWRDNTYPGCACDIPSPLYSYSFSQTDDWSRLFAPQPEILQYLRDFARRRGLLHRIQFSERVDSARWDDQDVRWHVTTSTGSTYRSRYLIIAVGPLHHPLAPTLPGQESFRGTVFHSAQWRHDVDLRGKKVVVVGTGASAIQFVPNIVDEADNVTVVQRTPPWILPKVNRDLGRRYRLLAKWFPPFRWYKRAQLFWVHEKRAPGFVDDPTAMRETEELARSYLRREVPDPELRAQLTPDYEIGCKRLLISSDWYKALQRPNVQVVAGSVRAVGEQSVTTEDGTQVRADVIIFGTGFDSQNSIRIDVTGTDGRSLAQDWEDGNEAYLGTTIAGYPNLATMVGPNVGLGHNSQIFMIESQARYIVDLLKQLRRRGARSAMVRPEVQRDFNRWLQGRMARTVWQSGGCRSYYQDRSGRNTVLWPDSSVAFWRRTRTVRMGDYIIDEDER